MSLESLYNNIVKGCKICLGSGIKSSSNTEVEFCSCMKFYTFVVRMVELGVPMKFIYSYKEVHPIHKINFIFKDDVRAFNIFMTIAKTKRMELYKSTFMFLFSNYSIDGFMVYDLGLETFSNNSLALYRLIKEAEDNKLYAIFSFAIDKDRLKFHYSDGVVNKIYGRQKT